MKSETYNEVDDVKMSEWCKKMIIRRSGRERGMRRVRQKGE